MGEQKECRNCLGERWVCENHLDLPWEHSKGCDCGAGAPCPVCNDLHEASILNRAAERIQSLAEPDFGLNDHDEWAESGCMTGRAQAVEAVLSVLTPHI